MAEDIRDLGLFFDAAADATGVDAQMAGERAGQRMARRLGLAFGDAFEDTLLSDRSYEGVLRGLVTDIQATVIKTLTQTAMVSMLGSGSGGSLFASVFESVAGLFSFAEGGVMTASGALPLQAYASGGIADSPQLALFGEGRQPEAYVPLPDGRSIPVQMEGAPTPGVSIVNHITVNAADVAGFRRAEGQIGAEIAATLQRHFRRYG